MSILSTNDDASVRESLVVRLWPMSRFDKLFFFFNFVKRCALDISGTIFYFTCDRRRPCVMSCNQRHRHRRLFDPACASGHAQRQCRAREWCVPLLHYFHVLFTIDWMRAHRMPNEPNTFDTWIQVMVAVATVDDDMSRLKLPERHHWQTHTHTYTLTLTHQAFST